jgi:hypothetical protein
MRLSAEDYETLQKIMISERYHAAKEVADFSKVGDATRMMASQTRLNFTHEYHEKVEPIL